MVVIRRSAQRRKLPLTVPIEAVPFDPKPITKRVAVFDTETDPFAHQRIVAPFSCGFYIPDADFYIDFWGRDCVAQFFAWMAKECAPGGSFEDQEFLILVHNGGNFDFFFMVDFFDSGQKPFIINGRLVRVFMQGHEFRDSFAMMPFALGEYDKIKFDYTLMEEYPVCCAATRVETTVRELYKKDILEYQKRDCTALAELVLRWFELFGNRLTIASAGMALLRSYHGFETLPEHLDDELRPFYFGGRNQCFATGIIKGNFKLYDINSSYMNAMRNFMHPISDVPKYEARITSRTHFAYIRAWSLGALPVRNKDGSLSFPIGTHDFHACIHEIRAGLETKTLRIIKVYHSIYFESEGTFEGFVDDIFGRRTECTLSGDKAGRMHYKYGGNAPYGKFAQDPRKYENWLFDPDEPPQPQFCGECHARLTSKNKSGSIPPQDLCECPLCSAGTHNAYGWYLHTTREGRNIYASPQRVRGSGFFNVATASSITSAARAGLLRGLQCAVRPLYCDTDSIICEELSGEGIHLDPVALGAWDIEASGDTVCIAGKKLYAIFNSGTEIKKASKGVKLSANEIWRVCEGETIEYSHPVPKFQLNGDVKFTTRNIRRTG